MRLHFKKTFTVDDVYDELPNARIGAVHLREQPNTEVLVDVYDSATPQQIQRIIDRATLRGLVLIRQEPGTFVVEGA